MTEQLHETFMGRKLTQHTLPEIARQLERIADALEKQSEEKQNAEIVKAAKAYLNGISKTN
jgi:hemerythrin-like domain-containing protein